MRKEKNGETLSENVIIELESKGSSKKPFDQSLWLILEPSLTKYHKEHIKKIKKSFDFIVDYHGGMFNDRNQFFTRILRKEIAKSKTLKKESGQISIIIYSK